MAEVRKDAVQRFDHLKRAETAPGSDTLSNRPAELSVSVQSTGSAGLTIRLIPDLSAAAFRSKQADELALWLCLRAIEHRGSSILRTEAAIEGLTQAFGYTRRTAFRHLAKGEGKFFQRISHKLGPVIEIYSLKRVAGYLNTCLFERKFREIPAEEFNHGKRGEKQRAQLYASIHRPQGVNTRPVSRQSIEDMTKLHEVQQRRYEKAVKVKRSPNYATYNNDGQERPQRLTITTRQGQYQVNKRLGNTYHTQQQPSSKGMLKRVGAQLGFLLQGEAPIARRYFQSASKLLRAKNRASDAHYRVMHQDSIIPGRSEWSIVMSQA